MRARHNDDRWPGSVGPALSVTPGMIDRSCRWRVPPDTSGPRALTWSVPGKLVGWRSHLTMLASQHELSQDGDHPARPGL